MSMYAINDSAINQTVVQRAGSNPSASPSRPYLRLVGPPTPVPRRTSQAVFWCRRLAVLFVIVALAAGIKVLAGAAAGPETARAASINPAATAQARGQQAYVVKQGDTLWAIARRLQPDGDVRPVVHRLAALRQGAPLRVGERITLP